MVLDEGRIVEQGSHAELLAFRAASTPSFGLIKQAASWASYNAALRLCPFAFAAFAACAAVWPLWLCGYLSVHNSQARREPVPGARRLPSRQSTSCSLCTETPRQNGLKSCVGRRCGVCSQRVECRAKCLRIQQTSPRHGRLSSRFGLRRVQSRNEQGVSVHKKSRPSVAMDGNRERTRMYSQRVCGLCTER